MRKIIIANWKSFGAKEHAAHFVARLNKESFSSLEVVIAPTFPYLYLFQDFVHSVAVQNISYDLSSLASTGEVTVDIVRDFGVKYCILGHSERMRFESYDTVLRKIAHVKSFEGMTPILCITSLADFEVYKEEIFCFGRKIVLAYEPIESIGSGFIDYEKLLRSFNAIRDKTAHLRDLMLIYGGSVSSENVVKLDRMLNVDGFIIGSASTKIDSFADILNLIK